MKTNRRDLLSHALLGIGASSIPGVSWAENQNFIDQCRAQLVELYPTIEREVIDNFLKELPQHKDSEVYKRCRTAFDAGHDNWVQYLVLAFMSYSQIFESQMRALK